MMFPKSQFWNRLLQLIRQYTTYLVQVYTTNLIIYSNHNVMNFTIVTLVYSVAMIPVWMVISLECIREALLATFSSVVFNTMALNSKPSKVVSYIQCNKAWERIYIILKLLFPCLLVLRLADSNKSGMENFLLFKNDKDLHNKIIIWSW